MRVGARVVLRDDTNLRARRLDRVPKLGTRGKVLGVREGDGQVLVKFHQRRGPLSLPLEHVEEVTT